MAGSGSISSSGGGHRLTFRVTGPAAGALQDVFKKLSTTTHAGSGVTLEAFQALLANCDVPVGPTIGKGVFGDVAQGRPVLSFSAFCDALGLLAIVQYPDADFTQSVWRLLSEHILLIPGIIVPPNPDPSVYDAKAIHILSPAIAAGTTRAGYETRSPPPQLPSVPETKSAKVILQRDLIDLLGRMFDLYASTHGEQIGMSWPGFVAFCKAAGIITVTAGAASSGPIVPLSQEMAKEAFLAGTRIAIAFDGSSPLAVADLRGTAVYAAILQMQATGVGSAAIVSDVTFLSFPQFLQIIALIAVIVCPDGRPFPTVLHTLIAAVLVPKLVPKLKATPRVASPATAVPVSYAAVSAAASAAAGSTGGAAADWVSSVSVGDDTGTVVSGHTRTALSVEVPTENFVDILSSPPASARDEDIAAILSACNPALQAIFDCFATTKARRLAGTEALRDTPMAGPLRYAHPHGVFTVPQLDVPALKRVFLKLDVDGSGTLMGSELDRIISAIGRRLPKQVADAWQRSIREVERDGGEGLNFHEFMESFRLLLANHAHLLCQDQGAKTGPLVSPTSSAPSALDSTVFSTVSIMRHLSRKSPFSRRSVSPTVSASATVTPSRPRSASAPRRRLSMTLDAAMSPATPRVAQAPAMAWDTFSETQAESSTLVVMTVKAFVEFAKAFQILGETLSRAELLEIYRRVFQLQMQARHPASVLLTGLTYPYFIGALVACAQEALSKHPYNATSGSAAEKLHLFLRRMELSEGKLAMGHPMHYRLFPALTFMAKSGDGYIMPSHVVENANPLSEFELVADREAEAFVDLLLSSAVATADTGGSTSRPKLSMSIVPDVKDSARKSGTPATSRRAGNDTISIQRTPAAPRSATAPVKATPQAMTTPAARPDASAQQNSGPISMAELMRRREAAQAAPESKQVGLARKPATKGRSSSVDSRASARSTSHAPPTDLYSTRVEATVRDYHKPWLKQRHEESRAKATAVATRERKIDHIHNRGRQQPL